MREEKVVYANGKEKSELFERVLKKSSKVISVNSNNEVFYYFAQEDIEKDAVTKVMQKYPARITPYLSKLMQRSEAIRKQYLPAPEELNTDGTATPFEEGKDTSATYGLERLYRDRVLLTPHFDCPAYCRFCYKKSRVMRGKQSMSFEEIERAVSEVGQMENVRGALITGGEPFMNTDKLFFMLDKLHELKNIFEIRIGTRCLLTMPELFTDELCEKIASYNRPSFSNISNSKYVAINVHFNHPDELAPEVIRAGYKLTSRGITLRNQAVLLKGINDDIKTIKQLFSLLLRNNIIPYYFNHCMPVEGADHFRTSVQKGLDIYKDLCTESATIIPNYVYAPSGGKVHVGPDTQLDYVKMNDQQVIKTKMLYRADEFRKLTSRSLPPMHSETDDGYIESYYLDGTDNK